MQLNLSKTGVATASDLTWRPFYIPSASLTTTGNTNVTTATGLNLVEIAAPTIVDDGSNFTVTNSATLYIGGAPSDGGGSGTVTITNPYSVWVDSGVSRFDDLVEARGQFSANTNGSVGTLQNNDTPSVSTGNLWQTGGTTTITNFANGIAGQTITVISVHSITFDITDTNLKAGTTDISTESGDVTVWTFNGTNWYLVQFMDSSTDMATPGGGGGASTINDLTDAYADNPDKNLIIGHEATTIDDTSAFYNTGVGYDSLNAVTTGDNNTSVGYQAGDTITTGSNNTCIGSGTDVSGSGASNQTAIGYGAECSGNNEITLGNGSVTTLRCGTTTIATLSDKRDKKDIEDCAYGEEFINKVKPRKFTWEKRVLNESDKNFSKNGKQELGFIAQEFQEAMEGENKELLDLVLDTNPERLEIKSGNLLPIMVKALQEMSSKIKDLESEIKILKSK